MKRTDRSLPVFLLLLVVLTLGVFTLPATTVAQDTPISALDFQNAMRKLWEDHITWTRLYIVSFVADLPDADLVAERLLQNQTDIGDAIKPIYGDEAGNQLAELLKEHITGAVNLLTAAKGGDTAAVDEASAAWNTNGEAIATFLNGANPDHWPLEDLKAEMQMHLDLTLKEAQARLAGDYEADIAAYEEVHEHILGMADILSTGIIKQFPEKFAAATQS